MPKFLLIFSKDEPVRWLGHLDILRTFERAIRRAGLPVAFSGGFNPREKIAFASALGTGITAGAERAVLELTETASPAEVISRLNLALPEGIRIRDCEEITEAQEKATLAGFDRGEYEVTLSLPDGTSAQDLENGIASLLARDTVPVTREKEGKKKIVDIRPNLFSLTLLPETVTPTRAAVCMRVGQGENGTAKPPEVVAALAEQIPGLTLRRSHRVRPLSGKTETALPDLAQPEKENDLALS